MATKKITKVEKYYDVIRALRGQEMTLISTEEAISFIENEIELLQKKNSRPRGTTKPTAKQLANETLKTQILEYLSTVSEGQKCSDLIKGIPEFTDFTPQKISALMRQLTMAGAVKGEKIKGVTHFTLA